MLTSIQPKTWVTGEQITPEGINRNFSAVQQQLESASSRRWRRQNFMFPRPPSGTNYFCVIPVIAGVDYIVERITVYGTYTGDKTLKFGTIVNGVTTEESFALPADGNAAVDGGDSIYYTGTVLPGTLVPGSTIFASSDQFYVKLDNFEAADNLAICVGIRTRRGLAGTILNTTMSTQLTKYKDQTGLSASTYNTNVELLRSFANEFNSLDNPVGIFPCNFQSVSNGDSQILHRDRLVGNLGMEVREIKGKITMATAGGGPDPTVDIKYGFGTASNTLEVSVNGQTSIYFTTGTISLSNNPRTDDFIVEVTNNSTSQVLTCQAFVETIRP